MKKKLNIRKVLALVLALVLGTACLAGCSEPTAELPEDTTPPAPVVAAEDLMQQRSFLLAPGESVQLTLGTQDVVLTSENPEVVSVDAAGNVKALKKGTAMITAQYNGDTDYCGVIVDGVGEMIDISKLEQRDIFTDLYLHSKTEVVSMAISPDGATVYLSQGYGISAFRPADADVLVNKITCKDGIWELGSWMRFFESGTGYIGLTTENGEDRLWMESGGSIYGTGIAVSRFAWEDEACYRTVYGDTITLADVNMPGVTAETESGLLLVKDQSTGDYAIYNSADLLSGKSPVALRYITCASKQTPAMGEDPSQGRYNAALKAFVLHDGYIYQLSGNKSVYLTVFDLEGKLQYCHRLEEQPDMLLRKPAALSVTDGKIYVLMQGGDATHVQANLWVYEAPAPAQE